MHEKLRAQSAGGEIAAAGVSISGGDWEGVCCGDGAILGGFCRNWILWVDVER